MIERRGCRRRASGKRHAVGLGRRSAGCRSGFVVTVVHRNSSPFCARRRAHSAPDHDEIRKPTWRSAKHAKSAEAGRNGVTTTGKNLRLPSNLFGFASFRVFRGHCFGIHSPSAGPTERSSAHKLEETLIDISRGDCALLLVERQIHPRHERASPRYRSLEL